jgi:hypothetical protein
MYVFLIPIAYPSLPHYRHGLELLKPSITDSSNAAASSAQPNAGMGNYPHYDGPVPIVRSQSGPVEEWEFLKSQLFGTIGIEEGKNHDGHSILADWLEQIPDKKFWRCKVPVEDSDGDPCGAGFSRTDRAIVHIRGKHLEMRPFRCDMGGKCEISNWLAQNFSRYRGRPLFADSNCVFQYYGFRLQGEPGRTLEPEEDPMHAMVYSCSTLMGIILTNPIVVKLSCAKMCHGMYKSVTEARCRPIVTSDRCD